MYVRYHITNEELTLVFVELDTKDNKSLYSSTYKIGELAQDLEIQK